MEQEKEIKEPNLIDNNVLALIDDIMAKKTETEERFVLDCMGLDKTDKHIIKNGLRNRHFTADNIFALLKKYNGNANFIFGFDDKMYR